MASSSRHVVSVVAAVAVVALLALSAAAVEAGAITTINNPRNRPHHSDTAEIAPSTAAASSARRRQSMDLNQCWELILEELNAVVDDEYPVVIDQFSSSGHVLTFEPGAAEGLVPYENRNGDAEAHVNADLGRVDFYASLVPMGNLTGGFSVHVAAPGGSGTFDMDFFDHFDYFYFRAYVQSNGVIDWTSGTIHDDGWNIDLSPLPISSDVERDISIHIKTGVDWSTSDYFMDVMLEGHVFPVLKEELENNPNGPCGVLLMA